MAGTYFKAWEVRAGQDTIVDRDDDGHVRGRFHVLERSQCPTDPSNMHLVVQPVGEKSTRTWCYFREAQIEIL